jgi:hypothetical protein
VDTTGTSAFIVWIDASGTTYEFYPDLVISEKWTENATVTEHPVEQGSNVTDHVRVELSRCELVIFATNEPIGPNSFQAPSLSAIELQGLPGAGQAIPPLPTADVWDNELPAKAALLGAGAAIGGAIGGAAGTAIGGALGALAGAFLAQPHDDQELLPLTIAITAAPQVEGQAQTYTFDQDQDFVEATVQLLEQLKNAAQVIAVNGSKQVNASMVIEAFSYTRDQSNGTGAEIAIAFKELRVVQTQTVSVPLVPGAATPVTKGTQNPSDGTPAQQTDIVTQLLGFAGVHL